MQSLLIACLLIPLVGAVLVAMMVRQGAVPARRLALITSLITLACVVRLVCDHLGGMPVEVSGDWVRYSSIHIAMSLGLDGLSLWMFGLTGAVDRHGHPRQLERPSPIGPHRFTPCCCCSKPACWACFWPAT